MKFIKILFCYISNTYKVFTNFVPILARFCPDFSEYLQKKGAVVPPQVNNNGLLTQRRDGEPLGVSVGE